MLQVSAGNEDHDLNPERDLPTLPPLFLLDKVLTPRRDFPDPL